MEKVFKRRLSQGARDAAAEKPRSGTAGASAALPACRSDRRMCIVGGRNDATGIMRRFWLGCNLYLRINHELRKSAESAGGYEAGNAAEGDQCHDHRHRAHRAVDELRQL